MCLSLPGVEVGAPKIAIFENTRIESKFTLGLNTVKNTDYVKKRKESKMDLMI